ncbi:protein of unknown function [Candidatus Nitrosocosmicus franklandus]|uniref:Uncharacterized protein n=1 Tax=Candidatus Nitrosocosmicus franklandianus TaxID=1798806 RepID=A0A484I9I2_9ARCH|nr:protein of unknown function [Candidatus Nitrosocosmicus franklandus]
MTTPFKKLNQKSPQRNLPKHLVSDLDPDDCIHYARVCDSCDGGSEYWHYWWD